MKKQIVNLSVIAAMLVGGISAAQAAGKDAQIHIYGSIQNHTCQLSTNVADLNLQNWVPTDFTDATTKVGTQSFNLNFSGCAGTALKADDILNVMATGQQLNSDLWGDADGPNPTNAGVALVVPMDAAGIANVAVTPTQNEVAIYKATAAVSDLSGVKGSLPFEASLVSPAAASVKPGRVDANITFTMPYN